MAGQTTEGDAGRALKWLSRTEQIMRYTKMIATLAMVVACTAPCWADTTIPAKLTVTEAVSLALESNPGLKQSRESKRVAESDLKVVGFRSSLNFGSNATLDRESGNSDLSSLVFSRFSYENFSGTQAIIDVKPLGYGSSRGAFGVSLRQALSKGRGLLSDKGLALKSAQSGLVVESKQEFLSEQATIQGVVEAYYNAVLAREEVKVRESAVRNAEIAADGWRKREEAGIAAGIEVTRSEVQVSQTKNQLNAQQRNARNSLDRLMIAIGGGVGQTPELVDTVPNVTYEPPPLGDAVRKALANRVELDISDERLSEQQRQLAVAKDAGRPQLDFVAGFNGSGNTEGFMSRSILDSGLLTTGIEYSIPLDRRITHEKQLNATRQMDLLHTQRDFEMEQISEQVRSAYRRLESARASLEILAQNKISAEDNLRIANRMMEEGEGSSRDVLEAQQSLTQADSSILSAKTDLFLATIDLKRAMGEDISTMEFK